MNATDLDFAGAGSAPAGRAVDLAFGAPLIPTPTTASATLHLRVGAPIVRLRVEYDNRVARKREADARLLWNTSLRAANAPASGWSDTARDRTQTGFLWQPANPLDASVTVFTRDTFADRMAGQLCWEATAPITIPTTERLSSLSHMGEENECPWEKTIAIDHGTASGFVELVPLASYRLLPWQMGISRAPLWQARFARGVEHYRHWTVPWEIGRRPDHGESSGPTIPPIPVPPPHYALSLNFLCPATQSGLAWRPLLHLDFGVHPCPCGTVPTLPVYVVTHTITVVRLPGREPIPVKSVEVSSDADSWAWGFTASVPYAALEMIAPTRNGPVEIEITIDGIVWVVLVESYEARREFGQSSLSLRGRSLAAYLAEPYAPTHSFTPTAPFTAQQLAENELNRPGLVTGFTLDWRLPDWLVPEGSWSVQGASPMSAIGQIVAAVGGSLTAHPRGKTLMVQSRYPTLPWEWSTVTADRTLPLDVMKTLNLRWQEKPTFNAVYVAGERQGVIGHAVRSGTAGDRVAPMVVDALITHADAARERGRAILADTGKQALVTLELPLLPAIGLLDPGRLIAVNEANTPWRALVRATRISVSWNESLIVRQTIEVERHYL